MIKLTYKTCIVLAIIAFSYVLITYANIYTAYHDRSDYKEFIHYRYDLLRTTTSPKLICIGGSNLIYGLDSGLLTQDIKIPVINMGVHAGVGLKFMIESVKPFIKNKDIIVLSPEYEHFYGQDFYGNIPLLDILFLYPAGWKYINLTDIRQIKSLLYCNSWRPISINLFKKNKQPMRNAYNKNGDIANHLKAKPVRPLNYNKINSDYFNVVTVTAIKDFSEFVKARGAKLIYNYPPIVEYKYIDERKQIDRVRSAVADMPDIPSSHPEINVYPEDHFYDSVYHLNAAGRKARTEKLIEQIHEMLMD